MAKRPYTPTEEAVAEYLFDRSMKDREIFYGDRGIDITPWKELTNGEVIDSYMRDARKLVNLVTRVTLKHAAIEDED